MISHKQLATTLRAGIALWVSVIYSLVPLLLAKPTQAAV